MNLLKLDLLLFWEFVKLYEQYGLKFKLVQQNSKTHRYFNLVCLDNNEILLRNFTKKMLIGILQDDNMGLYSSPNQGIPFKIHDKLLEKINCISQNMQKLLIHQT